MNVLFDLDGTLTDPGDGFVACVSHAPAKLECRAYADHEIRRHVGPPLEETLARLIEDKAKIPAAVAFYRDRYSVQGFLEHFGLSRHFRAIHGSELDGTRSNKTQLVRHILALESLDPAQTLMVGDRAQDMAAARAHGLHAVGALWGYGSREELAGAGAAVLCERPADLLTAARVPYPRAR